MVAGLEDVSTGVMKIGDRVVNTLSPRERDIAMVFQSYALYPHMTVGDNIAYGLKIRKMDKAEIAASGEEGRRHARARPDAGAQTQTALGWSAAAGGDGPGHCP